MTPHDAIADTLTFLRDYYTQLDRLLSDVTRQLSQAEPAWQRLRRSGDSYETECEVKVGKPEFFQPRFLGLWYAPAAAFGGQGHYSADPAATPRVAYAGVWLGDADNPPELYAGWLEGMPWNREKSVETHLKGFNSWLDPWECEPPQELCSLEEVVFEARTLRWSEGEIRLAMGRVRLAEIDGPTALAAFMDRWLGAMQR